MKKDNIFQITQVKVPIEYDEDNIRSYCAAKMKISGKDIISTKVLRRSIDARKKEDVHYSLTTLVEVADKAYRKLISFKKPISDVSVYKDSTYIIPAETGSELSECKQRAGHSSLRPVIIGSGPAGLFAAYILALKGFKPLIIERGQSVEKRAKAVEKFWLTGELMPESNVQFGEGGAGTFSDGKLNTLVKDTYGRIRFMLETFVEFGANPEILISNKPHVGTDVLKKVLVNIRNKIISLGGEYRFETKLTDIIIKDGTVKEIILNGEENFVCDTLVLALGHSARDTFKMLYNKGFEMMAKPFAVGVRVEHPQRIISEYQYGEAFKKLPPADYKVTHTGRNGRGVYSFCMCPGGYVVNSASEAGGILVNGMSYSDRGSENANSAIVATVNAADFEGDDALSGVRYQRRLEEAAFKLGHGKIPIQLFGDFLNNKKSTGFGEVKNISKGKTEFANLKEILPEYISESLAEGIRAFGKKIKGFDREDMIMSGIESRTSSPLRIIRDVNTMESRFKGIYPIGEGAGYAGGITSSAVDGIKVAEIIIRKKNG